MVHPQKRIFIKKVLESTICRICEMKKDMVLFNPRPKSIYVHLDQLLFDLKYDPSIIEIPVPRYFKEDDRLKVDILFKEPVVREGGKKKGGKKGKGYKKGKKGKKKAEPEVKPEPKSMDEKQQMVDFLLMKYNKTTAPEQEIVHDPFTLDMDFYNAIRLIQKNERGRQGRGRYLQVLQKYKNVKIIEQTRKKLREGKLENANQQEKEQAANEFVQRRIRGILARMQVEELRQEEMIFLGMQRKPKTEEEKTKDVAITDQDKTRVLRKNLQSDHMNKFEVAKEELKDEIKEIEGNDIEDAMLKKRRDWIQEVKAVQGGKPPDDIQKYYDRLKTETPLSPEEEEAKKLEEEEEAKKKKDKKKEKKKPGKKGKKGGGAEPEEKQIVKIGPSEVVRKFEEFYEDYNDVWANRDETENHNQEYDREMAVKGVRPLVEKDYEEEVDAMIKMELENMRTFAGIGKKKKKGKKGGRKGKGKGKKKKKTIKLPGYKYIKDRKVDDLLVELVQANIVKKLPPQNLKDFIGEFNYIHSMLDDNSTTMWDPSMALIRQLVTEYIIFPLGSALVRKRFPEHVRSFLFYGPAGTGKTQVVRAIAEETKSIVFDLSPLNIEG